MPENIIELSKCRMSCVDNIERITFFFCDKEFHPRFIFINLMVVNPKTNCQGTNSAVKPVSQMD